MGSTELYASSDRITDHYNTEDKRGKCRAPNPGASPVMEKDLVEPAEHVEQARSKRRSFATSFHASKL